MSVPVRVFSRMCVRARSHMCGWAAHIHPCTSDPAPTHLACNKTIVCLFTTAGAFMLSGSLRVAVVSKQGR